MTSLREFLRRNPWQKLFSLLLATLVWATVRQYASRGGLQVPGPDAPTRLFANLPVRILTLATSLNTYQVDPGQITVVVRGRASTLSRLRAEDIEVYVNLTDLSETEPVRRPVHVNVAGVQVVLIAPEEVLIEPVPTADKAPETAPGAD